MDGKAVSSGSMLQTTVIAGLKAAPVERKQDTIKSVFPQLAVFKFSPFGDSFVGAYKDKVGTIYAVNASAHSDIGIDMLPTLKEPSKALELHNTTPSNFRALGEPSSEVAAPAADLKINTLLTMSPMVPDPTDPSGYRDSVSTQAMSDFHDIIVYYMDSGLRETFISATNPTLDPRVKAIADDDTINNSIFYKKLQTPYLASFLGNSKLTLFSAWAT
jgi:hypothetical protein